MTGERAAAHEAEGEDEAEAAREGGASGTEAMLEAIRKELARLRGLQVGREGAARWQRGLRWGSRGQASRLGDTGCGEAG